MVIISTVYLLKVGQVLSAEKVDKFPSVCTCNLLWPGTRISHVLTKIRLRLKKNSLTYIVLSMCNPIFLYKHGVLRKTSGIQGRDYTFV